MARCSKRLKPYERHDDERAYDQQADGPPVTQHLADDPLGDGQGAVYSHQPSVRRRKCMNASSRSLSEDSFLETKTATQ